MQLLSILSSDFIDLIATLRNAYAFVIAARLYAIYANHRPDPMPRQPRFSAEIKRVRGSIVPGIEPQIMKWGVNAASRMTAPRLRPWSPEIPNRSNVREIHRCLRATTSMLATCDRCETRLNLLMEKKMSTWWDRTRGDIQLCAKVSDRLRWSSTRSGFVAISRGWDSVDPYKERGIIYHNVL